MKRIFAVAAMTAAILATAAAVPAMAAPRYGTVANDVSANCIALTVTGRQVTGTLCGGRGQDWRYGGPRLSAPGGLCLTATATGQVTAERCGRAGQRWNRIDPDPSIRDTWRVGSQRFPGWCLALSPAYVAPVQLDPCGGPPVADGGTLDWVFE